MSENEEQTCDYCGKVADLTYVEVGWGVMLCDECIAKLDQAD